MSLREAVERAGSLDALLPLLVQGLILARATSFQEWPSGAPMKLPSLDIGSIWWGTVRSIDPDAGRVCFAMDFFEVMAIGVALERAAVEATWPAKASAKPGRRRKPGQSSMRLVTTGSPPRFLSRRTARSANTEGRLADERRIELDDAN